MPAHDDIQDGLAEAFDALRDEFFDGFTEPILLKTSSTTNTFEEVETISSKWFFEYSDFRQNFKLEIAEGWELSDSIAEATHVQIDDDIYVIRNGDTVEPKGTDVTWKLFCDKFTKRGQFTALY